MFIQCLQTFVTHAHEYNANYFGQAFFTTNTTQVLHLTILQGDEQMPVAVLLRVANSTHTPLNPHISLI